MTARGILSRRELLGAGVAGVGLMALGGCGPSPQRRPAAASSGAGAIRVASMAASTKDTLDPAKGAMATDYVRHYMLYSGLTSIDDDSLRPRPALAESFDSDDRITWHFRLRRGVRFHDGAPLTSADVVHSLRRHNDPAVASKIAAIAAQFAEVRADGRYGVTIRLTGANADLPTLLAQAQFLIVKAGQDHPDGTGTGAYRLAQFEPGVRTLVVRNREYWIPGRPHLEQVELIAIPDETSRVNALLSGDVHAIHAINPHSLPRIEASGTCEAVVTPSSLYTNLIMRQDHLPTSSPDFVQAVKHMLDRPLINRALFRNTAMLGNDQPVAPVMPYFNRELPQTVLDLDRARWHVRRGGLNGLRLPLYCSPAATGSVDMASILQEYGSQVGLEFAVNRVPADGYWSTHWMRHAMTFGNNNPRPTADLVFSLFFQSNAEWNESGWKNERFDRLLTEARGEADEVRRGELYGEMQRLVHDRCGIAIPVFISLCDGYDKRLKGIKPIPLGGFMGYRFAEFARWED
ncbi:ABC transporter substrate-binding protein [Novosphingobium colocasiae]|uniref:ABC transporter substrate-binding protein n=1 Tax=Novosphingobium colocasiae TaxID=1256513 RepID=A0A918PGG2_9SPHN|nr:ABC transporter substrate-binding protein [Novosphingobium colocasiae]GGZ07918.1 ABC transporter substrate-binding protein [Novosphingobium colocasiae]